MASLLFGFFRKFFIYHQSVLLNSYSLNLKMKSSNYFKKYQAEICVKCISLYLKLMVNLCVMAKSKH